MLLIRRELYLNINSKKIFNEEEQFWDYIKKYNKLSLLNNMKYVLITNDKFNKLES